MPPSTAVRAADFLSTLGVAAHINYTDGQYVDISKDLSALQYLGISHVRDAAPNPNFDPTGQIHLGIAADAGLKFTFIANDPDPNLVVSRLHAFLIAHPGSVVGIEGPNEVNNWPVTYNGLTGTAGAQAYQQVLYNAVNADPLLKHIPVLGFTDWPVHASASDQNNIHPYAKYGDQPRASITGSAAAQNTVDPNKPFSITEMGYHTSLTADTAGGWEGVDEATQARLLLNAYMDAADLGAKSMFAYQLLDAYPDVTGSDQEKHFGLFRLDYTPKPVATAIHNLTTILQDGGTNAVSFNAGSLNYSVTGLPETGHTYLTEKSNGSYQIVAWNEPDIWDQVANRPITSPASTVKISLSEVFETVEIFDPLQGTAAVETFYKVSVIDLRLSDHPLIVELSSDRGATMAASSSNLFGTRAHDAASQGGTVYAVYDGLLGRAPDPLGMEGWAHALNHGLSVSDMAQAFLASPEGQVRAGALDNPAFVEQLYGSTLHRHSDAAGLQGWTSALAQGASRAEVALGFALSPEHLANIQGAFDKGVFVPDADAAATARLYYGILDRAPDAAGLAAWTSAVQHGTALTSVAQQFLASPEAQAKFGDVSDTMFVSNLYDNALGRSADASGLQGWTSALQHGTSRADVAVQIAESQEAQIRLVGHIETGWDLI